MTTDDNKTTEPKALTLGDIKKVVSDLVGEAVKGAKTTTDDAHDDAQQRTERRLDRGSTIADQVNNALTHIREKEERESRDKTIDQQLADLAAKTQEAPPVERRRVHKIMGWGE